MTRRAIIYGHDVGTGLTRHIAIVTDCLREAGYDDVRHRPVPPRGRGARLAAYSRGWLPGGKRADLAIFVQDIVPSALRDARTNVLLPMQEWFDPRELRLLPGIDHVLCTSQHAEAIFSWRGPNVVSFGFTCVDRLLDGGAANRAGILHVAGRSPYKGTRALAGVWRRHPDWPTLTLVHAEGVMERLSLPNVDQRAGHMDDGALQRLQNDAWLHLLPTEAEAFGHSLCEGLSVGALVVTTDAPPMNELIATDRGILVPFNKRERLNLGYRFMVDGAALEETLACILQRGAATYDATMRRARTWFLENDARVRSDLAAFFRNVA